MNPDFIKLPKPAGFLNTTLLKTLSKAFGIALVVQWFVPWAGSVFSWDLVNGGLGFTMVWSLLGGAGLIALGFIPEDILKDNLLILLSAVVGVLGLFSLTGLGGSATIGSGIPFLGFLGFIGLMAASVALMRWLGDGFSLFAWVLLIAGLGSMALWLVIPLGGKLPLLDIFTVFGASHTNVVWRIFVFLFYILTIGWGVLALLFVVLPKERAAESWISLLFWLGLVLIPVMSIVLGILGMFSSAWSLVRMLHIFVISVSYIATAFIAGGMILDLAMSGRLKDLFD